MAYKLLIFNQTRTILSRGLSLHDTLLTLMQYLMSHRLYSYVRNLNVAVHDCPCLLVWRAGLLYLGA